MTVKGLDCSSYQPPLPWPAFAAAGRSFVIVKISESGWADPMAHSHMDGAFTAGLDVGFYHFLTQADGVLQARTFDRHAPTDNTPMLGVPRFWVDVESGLNMAGTLTAFLYAWKQLRPNCPIGIYTGAGAWAAHVGNEHTEFGVYPLWNGSNPLPHGWTKAAIQQNPIAGHLPGYAGDIDLDEIAGELMPTMPAVMVPRGSLVAIHAINPDMTQQLVEQAVADGAPFAAVKILNDAEALAKVKKASPTTWCYLRYFDPDNDSLQGLDDWTTTQRAEWCSRVLTKIYSQITAEQCQWIDWACAWNEEDPPGPQGYRDLGETFLMLGQMNDSRKARGLTHVKLAFGCLAQGTPDLWEMQQLYDSGLFAWMHDHFYSWDDHEGVFAWEPIDKGMGDSLPSSPEHNHPGHGDVPAIAGSGSGCFRFVWLFERLLRPAGQLVPLLIGEWYPGVPGQLDRYNWYDDRLALYEYVTGFAPYNLGPTKDWPDLTPDYLALRQHRIDIHKRINGGLMHYTFTDDEFAALVASNQADAVIYAKHKPAPQWRVGDVALAVANPLQLYDVSHNASGAPRPNVAYDINISAVSADGLWLQVSPVLWARAADLKHKVA